MIVRAPPGRRELSAIDFLFVGFNRQLVRSPVVIFLFARSPKRRARRACQAGKGKHS